MTPEEDPDVQLMLAVKRDDHAAFEALFRKYIGQLVSFAFPFVGTRARAEELAQETFLQVFATRRRYEPRARFASWLFRIATNLCLSETRRAEHRYVQRPRPAPAESANAETGFDSMPEAGGRSSEDDVLTREMVDTMLNGLRGLPPKQRAALLLARKEGLAYGEIAHSLGCTVPAVKSLIHRATLSLRNHMSKLGEL